MDKVNKVLYIYGYGSSPEGNTATWLKKNLPNSKVYSEFYNQLDPYSSITYLCKLVEKLDIDMIIGSSLGGWYAMHVASKCNLPGIYINPVIDSNIESTLSYVTSENTIIVSDIIKYSKEYPLFETEEHWSDHRWDECENGYYSVLIWSDNDEIIKNDGTGMSLELKENFLNRCIVHNGKHQLTEEEKFTYILPWYNNLINEIVPKINNFYKNTKIIP